MKSKFILLVLILTAAVNLQGQDLDSLNSKNAYFTIICSPTASKPLSVLIIIKADKKKIEAYGKKGRKIFDQIEPSWIESMDVVHSNEATQKYGRAW